MSLTEAHIREAVGRYVAGDITLEEFAADHARVVHLIHDQSADVVDLAYQIELRLAEFSNGDWTEDELKGLLRDYATRYRVYVDVPVRFDTGSSADITVRVPVTLRVVDASRAGVSSSLTGSRA